jgi:HemY protein
MRALLWLVATFALAAALSIALPGSDGYAVLVLPPWRIEMALSLFFIVLLLAFVVAYLALRMVGHAVRLPSHVRAFRARQREQKGHRALLGAIQALFEGRFGRAEKLAAQARDLNSVLPLADLVAARAAQRMRDFDRRDEWLGHARKDEGEWRRARLVTEAELLLEERRFRDAREALQELHASGPRHIVTLTLLLRAEQGLGNWDEVLRLVRLLDKRSAMPPEALESIRVNARIAVLSRMTHDPRSLDEHWRELPEADRLHPKIAAAAARAFFQLGDCRSAHRVLAQALEHEWHSDLVLLYGECRDVDVLERIERAERWLDERPREPELLLTLGRLCAEAELWGKAISYLEASLALHPTRAAHVALAQMHESMGHPEDANRHYRAAADVGLAP